LLFRLLLPDSLDRLVLSDFHPKTVELDDGVAEQQRPGGGHNFHRLLVLHEGAGIQDELITNPQEERTKSFLSKILQ